MTKYLKKLLVSFMALLSFITLVGCGEDPYAGEYGKRIEEDLSTLNIIDDNYRNYYEIFVMSFCDSNFDTIGDLNGVIMKLDYLKDLGYNGIWLMPIHPSDSYHKYDVKDYYDVDKKYGTIEDLKKLIDECHKRDINIIIDLVLNHTSKSHPDFSKACQAYNKYINGQVLTAEEEKYKDYYVFYKNQNDVPSNITAYKVGTNYNFYYEANFSANMPEFNCDSPYVREEFKNIIKYYLDMGIDGFRLDAVKYYYLDNDKKNIELLNYLNTYMKSINPDAYMVGECWSSSEVIKNYYTSGVDSFFNFSTSVSYGGTSGVINGPNPEGRGINRYYQSLLDNISIALNGIPAPFLDNHDMPRYTYETNTQKNKFTFGLLAMMNGTIFSYYGDEVGLFGTNAGSTNIDQNVRIPIKWGDFTNPDCMVKFGQTVEYYPYPTVKEQLEDSNSILNYYKKVLLIRNQNPEIARGEIKLIAKDTDDLDYLFISKTYNGSEIGIVINFSQYNNLVINPSEYGFSKVTGQIVIESSQYVGEQKNGSIVMPPFSIVILKK